jgi:transcriptional regulator with XRE-family HTH domain
MYSVFVELMQERGVTPYQVSKETGIAQSTLSGWKISNRRPQTRTLKKLADYFGVSVQYLEGKTKDRGQKEKPAAPITEGELMFLEAAEALREAAASLKRGEVSSGGVNEVIIKITCPLDFREQAIHQPYCTIGNKQFPLPGNGCENYHQCAECEKCRSDCMLRILKQE